MIASSVTSADVTLDAITRAQTEFALSAEDYRALTVAISTGTPFTAPKNLSPERQASLTTLVSDGQLLTAAVKNASKHTSETATFITKQTAVCFVINVAVSEVCFEAFLTAAVSN